MIKLFKYWYYFFKELRLVYKYRRAALSIEADLEKDGLRVDWLGRIYTVINLKEELLTQPELMQQSYVLGQLGPLTNVLMKYGMADTSFPEIEKIKDSSSYLVILWPERDYLEWPSFLVNLFVTALIAVIIGVAIRYVPMEWVTSTIQYFSK